MRARERTSVRWSVVRVLEKLLFDVGMFETPQNDVGSCMALAEMHAHGQQPAHAMRTYARRHPCWWARPKF